MAVNETRNTDQPPKPIDRPDSELGTSHGGSFGFSNNFRPRENPLRQAALWLPLAYIWFCLICDLSYEWRTDPQYGYGWVVPILCCGLLARRWHRFDSSAASQSKESGAWNWPGYLTLIVGAVLAISYLPTRLIDAAIPEWRPVPWVLGIETIGLTLCAVELAKGRAWLRQLAFPICFFLVAIPWPTLVERAIIQSLTRASSIVVVHLVSALGVPVIPHGNLIEVSGGMVGIDEACSGIRSFQASLMVSLFFGEFYAMNLARRIWLVVAGASFAIVFNLGRMSLLTWVAAKKGIATLSQYHDPVGLSTTLFCTIGLWGLSALITRRNPPITSPQSIAKGSDERLATVQTSSPILPIWGLGLLLWLAAVDIGVQVWYRTLESHLVPGPNWSVTFPTNNPTFVSEPINADTALWLSYDEGQQAEWADADGSNWKFFYFSWKPGRVAGYLAKRHAPEACLPAASDNVLSSPKLKLIRINNLVLPMRCYEFRVKGTFVGVFQCRWEAGVRPEAYVQQETTRFNLIRGIWNGRGNKGQKVLEVAVTGYSNLDQAEVALENALHKMVQVDSAL